ncbi:MAG: hypothetical protein O3C21_18675 [Verrucomicrobia bacterium]|nr:hypothetical protein [Verrucomicrobiota bacterium]
MKKPHIVTGSGIAVIAVAGSIIGYQYLENQNLRSEAAELRSTLNVSVASPSDGLPDRASLTKEPKANEADSDIASSMTSLRGILALRSPMGRMQALLTYVAGGTAAIQKAPRHGQRRTASPCPNQSRPGAKSDR